MSPNYNFTYFNEIHINSFILSIFLTFIFLFIPKIPILKNKINIMKYATFLGILGLSIKLFESIYRVLFENFSIADSIPLHFCNFALIIAGLYLITKKSIFFNILYFFSFGALAAIILPGVGKYYTHFYVYLFMINHFFEIATVLFGFIYMKEQITFTGYRVSILVTSILFIISFFYNKLFGTNFMFLETYIATFFEFIKPFYVYRVVLVLSFFIIMTLMYLFPKKFFLKSK